MTLLLPCSGGDRGRSRSTRSSVALEAQRNGRILLVEDNEEVGEFAETLLSELGHRVSWAQSAEQALALARAAAASTPSSPTSSCRA